MVEKRQIDASEALQGDQSVSAIHTLRSIRSPGCIQPHGCLLGVSATDRTIVCASINANTIIGRTVEDLLGESIEHLLTPNQLEFLHKTIEPLDSGRAWIGSFSGSSADTDDTHTLNVLCAHRQADIIFLEVGAESPHERSDPFSAQTQLGQTVANIRTASTTQSLLEWVVKEARQYTGFDRALAFQFDDSGAGSVVAESNGDTLPSFLGLHFPAVDVPVEARELYAHCTIRYVLDVDAAEVELLLIEDDLDSPNEMPSVLSLDLSNALLRSPDPCCIQYLKNIGVSSSLTISIVQQGKLWGFVSCHNADVKAISSNRLSSCQLLGQIVSMQLANVIENEDRQYRSQLQSIRAEFIRAIRDIESLEDALFQQGDLLLQMVGADGAAFCIDGKVALKGVTPDIEQVRQLLLWLNAAPSPEQLSEAIFTDDVFATSHLVSLYPEAEHFSDTASGLLVLRISRTRNSNILWFRPELLQTIEWAGEPVENYSPNPEETAKLHPRSSFELWKETVSQHSKGWLPCELDSANELRNSLINLVIAKLEELALINRELERSNQELDSFAYAASHDLKEPLRGIHNYSTFLLEDYADALDEGGIERLNTLVRLTQRMDSLIDALLQFSQIGRTELHIKEVDLNETVRHACEIVTASRRDVTPAFTIPRPLPMIHCDPLLMERVFSNLFSNAIKYTSDTANIRVEVGYLTKQDQQAVNLNNSGPLVFYVKDNGIGIRQRHLKTIFRLFKRLHAQKKYGGGTGAGLTIVKKIVERHGGQIWVQSEYGAGSTFFIAGVDNAAQP